MDLPSKEDFFTNNFNVITVCEICFEDFDNTEHAPTRISGNTNVCHHVFGLACLRRWLEDSNTCPKCREVLYYIPEAESDEEVELEEEDEEEEEEEEEISVYPEEEIESYYREDSHNFTENDQFQNRNRDEDGLIFSANSHDHQRLGYANFRVLAESQERPWGYLDYQALGFTRRSEAGDFVKTVWINLWYTYGLSVIYTENIELRVNAALERHARYPIRSVTSCSDWAKVLDVAKDIIRTHNRNGRYQDLNEDELALWIGKFGEVLNWNFPDDYDRED